MCETNERDEVYSNNTTTHSLSENRWDVSGAGQSAPPEVYLIFPKYIKKSAADRQSDRSVPGDTAECRSVSDISS